MEPATKRGFSGVVYLSHAARARRAAATFSSRVLGSIPHSRRRCGVDWKVHVSTTSQPTARNDSWIDWMISGLVRTRWATADRYALTCGPEPASCDEVEEELSWDIGRSKKKMPGTQSARAGALA